MKFIADFKDGDHIIEHYLCKFKQNLKTKAGKTYYGLKLQDKTGTIDAKVWELGKDIQDFNEGDMIKIDASALMYQNEMQLKVNKLRKSTEGEYAPGDYIPTTEKDIEAMYQSLTALIHSIQNTYIKTLLTNMLINNTHNVALLKSHSAAKAMHHSYLGGLLEHILSVTETCDFMAPRYKYINRCVLLAGAMLHDIGKIVELSPMPLVEYTDAGQLLGHIMLGVEMVGEEIRKIEGFPPALANLIKHLIVSHHGELEFGSPKLPNTAEAILLHFADNMDAKLKTIEEIINKDVTPGPWAGYSKGLNRYIRNGEF